MEKKKIILTKSTSPKERMALLNEIIFSETECVIYVTDDKTISKEPIVTLSPKKNEDQVLAERTFISHFTAAGLEAAMTQKPLSDIYDNMGKLLDYSPEDKYRIKKIKEIEGMKSHPFAVYVKDKEHLNEIIEYYISYIKGKKQPVQYLAIVEVGWNLKILSGSLNCEAFNSAFEKELGDRPVHRKTWDNNLGPNKARKWKKNETKKLNEDLTAIINNRQK